MAEFAQRPKVWNVWNCEIDCEIECEIDSEIDFNPNPRCSN